MKILIQIFKFASLFTFFVHYLHPDQLLTLPLSGDPGDFFVLFLKGTYWSGKISLSDWKLEKTTFTSYNNWKSHCYWFIDNLSPLKWETKKSCDVVVRFLKCTDKVRWGGQVTHCNSNHESNANRQRGEWSQSSEWHVCEKAWRFIWACFHQLNTVTCSSGPAATCSMPLHKLTPTTSHRFRALKPHNDVT